MPMKASGKSTKRLSLLRRYLLAGLAVLAPLVLTLFVLGYLLQLAHRFVGVPVERMLAAQVGKEISGWLASLLGFLIVVALVLIVGAVASTVIGRRLLAYSERVLLQLPLIRTVYAPAKQIVEFFVNPSAMQFGAVVLVRYPHPNSYAIGFVTGRDVEVINAAAGRRLVNVFIPFAPVPMTGTLLLVPEEELVAVDMSAEDALKMIVSGGVVTPVKEAVPSQSTERS
jgi:uncharacterized membrane protein